MDKESKSILNALPEVLASQIYDFSSPDTFARLALVSHSTSERSSRYRKSDRYVRNVMYRTLDRAIGDYSENYLYIRPNSGIPLKECMPMARRVGRVLINATIHGSLSYDDSTPTTDEMLICAARYCAVAFESLELLWWAAQKEGDDYSISLFRDAAPVPNDAEKAFLKYIASRPDGSIHIDHDWDHVYAPGVMHVRELITDFMDSSPRATWVILRTALPEYKLQGIFIRISRLLNRSKLLGTQYWKYDDFKYQKYCHPVLSAEVIMWITDSLYLDDGDGGNNGKFNASGEVDNISKCIGKKIEYSEELMHQAVARFYPGGVITAPRPYKIIYVYLDISYGASHEFTRGVYLVRPEKVDKENLHLERHLHVRYNVSWEEITKNLSHFEKIGKDLYHCDITSLEYILDDFGYEHMDAV